MIFDIAEWLKTTVLGVIVLGAAGSLLALFMIYIMKRIGRFLVFVFRKHLPEQAARIAAAYNKRRDKIMFLYGARLGIFSTQNPAWGVSLYLAYHLLCTVCLLIISATLTIIIFIIVCGTSSGMVLTTLTYILIVLAILFSFWSLRHFMYLFLPYRFFPALKEELKSLHEQPIEQETPHTGGD